MVAVPKASVICASNCGPTTWYWILLVVRMGLLRPSRDPLAKEQTIFLTDPAARAGGEPNDDWICDPVGKVNRGVGIEKAAAGERGQKRAMQITIGAEAGLVAIAGIGDVHFED